MASGQLESLRLGVLVSGGGTNLQAILDRCVSGELEAEVAVVISNNSRSGALARARQAGVPSFHLSSWTHPDEDALDSEIAQQLQDHGANLVLLSGYIKKIGAATLRTFRDRILNIHPALLPCFGGTGMFGEHVHRAVIESGVRYTGVTVHLVNEDYDQGPIVDQDVVRVLGDDTPESLSNRVLEVEHRLYAEVVRKFARGKVKVEGRRVKLLEDN